MFVNQTLQNLGQYRRQKIRFRKLKSNRAVKVHIQADNLRSISPFLCATKWCHPLSQGARVWLTTTKTIRNGNAFTAFAKRSSWYCFEVEGKCSLTRVYSAVPAHTAKEPVAASRFLRSCLLFSSSQGSTKVFSSRCYFVVPWRPEDWGKGRAHTEGSQSRSKGLAFLDDWKEKFGGIIWNE